MNNISRTAHTRFVQQYNKMLKDYSGETGLLPEDKIQLLQHDLHTLIKLADTYQRAILQLHPLAHEYKLLHRQLRIRLRKLQLQNTPGKKNK